MKIYNHLVSFTEWQEWCNYSEYIFEDYDAWRDTPSKERCNELFEKLSGEIKVYNIFKRK